MVMASKKISFIKVAFFKKNWPKNKINRQKKEHFTVAGGVEARCGVLLLPAALGQKAPFLSAWLSFQKSAILPKFI